MTKLLLTGLVVLVLITTYTQAVQCPSWARSYWHECNKCDCPTRGGQGGACTRMYCGPRRPICTPHMPVLFRGTLCVCDETGFYRFCA